MLTDIAVGVLVQAGFQVRWEDTLNINGFGFRATLTTPFPFP